MIENLVENDPRSTEQQQESASLSNGKQRGSHKQPLFLTSEPEVAPTISSSISSGQIRKEELKPTSADSQIEVYVSSICDPGHFYVQKVGPTSVALDKLVQDMTLFYDQESNKLTHTLAIEKIQVNDVVAVRFSTDGSWYRSKVAEINKNDYDEESFQIVVDFVDFGDCETVTSLTNILQLKEEFLKLSFQAIPVAMADIRPSR